MTVRPGDRYTLGVERESPEESADDESLDVLGVAGAVWGIGGIVALIGSAVFRLGVRAFDLLHLPVGAVHWFVLVAWSIWMLATAGYMGFYRGFAPRVAARAHHLRRSPRPLHVLLAPLFCVGFIYATRKRKLLSLALAFMMLTLVLLMRQVPQPWRAVIDGGVAIGIGGGLSTVLYFAARAFSGHPMPVPTDLPDPPAER